MSLPKAVGWVCCRLKEMTKRVGLPQLAAGRRKVVVVSWRKRGAVAEGFKRKGGRPTFVIREREACGRPLFSLVLAKWEGGPVGSRCFGRSPVSGGLSGEVEERVMVFLGFFVV